MIAADKMRVQGFHYPFPGLANIEKDGSGYRWVPARVEIRPSKVVGS